MDEVDVGERDFLCGVFGGCVRLTGVRFGGWCVNVECVLLPSLAASPKVRVDAVFRVSCFLAVTVCVVAQRTLSRFWEWQLKRAC